MIKKHEEKKEVVICTTIIEYFCDNCGKKLGEVEEESDAYPYSYGDYELTGGKIDWVGHLCNECIKKLEDRLEEVTDLVGREFKLHDIKEGEEDE